ncbi:MAG TPA: TGS domain-containing protein, partial [Sporolactobacillaceae bacterium]|nr:TGS domain-containing protein [Sporolactobacillaceae bacterium]
MANQIQITFPDGAVKAYDSGSSAADIAGSISKGLLKQAIAAKFNGELIDLSRPLTEDGSLAILKEDAPEALEMLRHTTTHVMAQAVKRLYDNVNLGVGPVIEEGFYYDMDVADALSVEDLPAIEKEMQ